MSATQIQQDQDITTIQFLAQLQGALDDYPGWISAEEIAVNLPNTFTNVEEAEASLQRLQAQGYVQDSHFKGDRLWRVAQIQPESDKTT